MWKIDCGIIQPTKISYMTELLTTDGIQTDDHSIN